MGVSHARKANHEGWGFQTPNLREVMEVEMECNHVTNDSINHLHNEAPIQTLDTSARMVICPENMGVLCLRPSQPSLYVSLHLASLNLCSL